MGEIADGKRFDVPLMVSGLDHPKGADRFNGNLESSQVFRNICLPWMSLMNEMK